MKDQIIRLLGQKNYPPANVPELLKLLRLPPSSQQALQAELARLEQSGAVARIKGNRYIRPADADLVPGRIRMNRAGRGFLQPDDTSLKEIAVSESATGTALHEDRVLVRREEHRKNFREGDQETGEVVRILERRRTQLVGTVQQGRQFLYVIPDDPRIPHDVYVPLPGDLGRPLRMGDKVVVELREWESRHTNPEGEIVEILGAPDTEGVDMLSVLRQYNLPLHFPKPVLAEAHASGATVDPRDLPGRLDCRPHQVVTIDPEDARDFDDAIYLEQLPAGQWRLWVHIADVSHYVPPGTALDTEARKRGNSTYLVDRVIPMLPEALSNELCSLKPQVDRLTKCVEFLLADDGRVLNAKFHSAVIHSHRRFAYPEVLAILQRPPTHAPVERMLHQAHTLAQKIRRLRFKAGSLELDFPETKIRLDEQGKILRIEKNINDVSHQLIEEFMLLANEAVAAHLMNRRIPALYRIHEEPDARRLEDYRREILAHHIPCGNLRQPAEVQKLLRRLATTPLGPALKIGFLKSLMRARYAVEPLGHYGLAKQKYTHFTSPIRRYADLAVHRALFDKKPAPAAALQEIAEHISVTERNSADAERDSKDVKLFAYLRAQLASGAPQAYPALVTDVRNIGFFVEVTGLAMSGLVPLSLMEDDFYIFDESRRQLVGRRTRRMIRLGDQLTVQVARVDSFKKQVDFRLAGVGKVEGKKRESAIPKATEDRSGNRRAGVGSSPRRPEKVESRSQTQGGGRRPEAGGRRTKNTGRRPPAGRPFSQRLRESRSVGQHPPTARWFNERPQAMPADAKRPSASRPFGQRAPAAPPFHQRPPAARTAGNRPPGSGPFGQRPPAARSDARRSSTLRPEPTPPPELSRPVLRSAVSQLPVAQRPLLKAGGPPRFFKRRR